jgi:HK97 family phage prohead protease
MGTIERRFFSSEIRLIATGMASSPGTAQGYSCTFGRKSRDLGGFKEKISNTTFDRTLQSGDDVYCLLNHDPNFPLGRLRNKSLQLSSDSKGLKMRCELPDTSVGRDVAKLLTRGDLDQMSFAFSVPPGGDSWGEEDDCECGDLGCNDPNCQRSRVKIRTLNNVRLHDVSIVQSPAYPGTSVHVSSMDPALLGRSHSFESMFPQGLPAEVRSHLGGRALDQAARRRSFTNLVLGL